MSKSGMDASMVVTCFIPVSLDLDLLNQRNNDTLTGHHALNSRTDSFSHSANCSLMLSGLVQENPRYRVLFMILHLSAI